MSIHRWRWIDCSSASLALSTDSAESHHDDHSRFFMLHCWAHLATWSLSMWNLTSLGLADVSGVYTRDVRLVSTASSMRWTRTSAWGQHCYHRYTYISPDWGLIISDDHFHRLTVKCVYSGVLSAQCEYLAMSNMPAQKYLALTSAAPRPFALTAAWPCA